MRARYNRGDAAAFKRALEKGGAYGTTD